MKSEDYMLVSFMPHMLGLTCTECSIFATLAQPSCRIGKTFKVTGYKFACVNLFRTANCANETTTSTANKQLMSLLNRIVEAQPFPILRAFALWLCFTSKALTCETALLLSIDISGSIDKGEYAIQIERLAEALQEPAISDALIAGQMALTFVHWSGVGHKALVLPWQAHAFIR